MFLDDRLEPLPGDEQWAYLAAVRRIDSRAVERVAGEAARHGSVIGVRRPGPTDDEEAEPWARPPSGRPRFHNIAEPLPERVRATLSQRLFVEKVGLPSPMLDQIKRLAAFQNPEFYKKQSMRLSTALTPRVISCAEELERYVGLPRGCRSDLEALLGEHGVGLDVEDKRESGPFEHRLVVRETSFRDPSPSKTASIQELCAALAADQQRNELILNDVIASLEDGRSPILLTERKDQLEFFAERLEKFARHLVVLHGTMTARARKAAKAQLADIPASQERLVLATGRYIGEGFDDARLDTLS